MSSDTEYLAKELHPDKNPNDPNANARFQEVGRAYETLKDNLERSKYDEDNPYHGLDRAAAQRAQAAAAGGRSGTAKRYAAGSTPGWTSASGRATADGFAHQSSSKPKYSYTEYDTWGQSGTGYGFSSSGAYRPSSTPKAQDYDDYGYSSRPKTSAYARTSAGRQHPTSANYGANGTSSSSTRPKSTGGTNPHSSSTSARYASASAAPQPAGFNVADYIRQAKEKQTREEQQAREEEEFRQRKSYEAKEQAKEQRRREEAARAESARASYSRFTESNGAYERRSTPANSYSYNYAEEDLERIAEETLRRTGKSGPSYNYPSAGPTKRTSRSSMNPPSSPKFSNSMPTAHETYAKYSMPPEDIDVVEATPSDINSPNVPHSNKDYFTKNGTSGPTYAEDKGTGVYPAPPNIYNSTPVQEKNTAKHSTQSSRPKHHMPGAYGSPKSSPNLSSKSPSPEEKAEEASSDKENRYVTILKFINYVLTVSRQKPSINVFDFAESSPNPNEQTPTFTKNPDINFTSTESKNFGHFTSNSTPEPQGDKPASMGSGPFLRPHSQPTDRQNAPPVPPPSAPPNLQQQRAAGVGRKTPDPTTKKGLLNNLHDILNYDFSWKPTSSTTSSAAKKKRSAPTLKRGFIPVGRPKPASVPVPTEDSETEAEEESSSPTAHFDPEPMDAEPTGTPKTMPIPATPKQNSNDGGLNISDLGNVPPLSRSPADVGLGGFDSMKDALPFQSTASSYRPLASHNARLRKAAPTTGVTNITMPPSIPSIPTEFWNLHPHTPYEEKFIVPKPPKIPKIPNETNLELYNRFYHGLGTYIELWNKYEAAVHSLRAELTSKSMQASSTQVIDSQDIVKYMQRVKEKDQKLDESFTRYRDKHMQSLSEWVKLRDQILEMQKSSGFEEPEQEVEHPGQSPKGP